jgi:response regulator RpfG family c-di-GMP phosphodiesterase
MRVKHETGTSSKHRASVLLVDDVPLLLKSLSRLLDNEYDVTCANSAVEALELLEGPGSYQVIVSDYGMPDLNGLDFLAEAARLHPEIGRVILTGMPRLELAVEAMNAGNIHRFLFKPCGLDELREAVDSGLKANESYINEEIEIGELEFSNESLCLLNENLSARIQEQRNSISAFRQLSLELNQVDDLDGIARVTAEAAFKVLGGRGVFVQIHDPLGVRVEHGIGPEMSAQMVTEPMITKDGTIGGIVADVIGPDGAESVEEQRDMLAAIASTAAVATHNELRRRERDNAQYATVVALARLSEMRDQETGQHLERVSESCELIALSLLERGLYTDVIDSVFIQDLGRSAPLHDIGKVGIPDRILLKQGKLDPEEWEIMKTHAEIGADTLRSVIDGGSAPGYLSMGLDIAYCHHERWDGSGYPRGLVGRDIPLSARILALSDVYDALTSVRPYKQAWTHEAALDLIKESRGSHFDPDLVDAFVARADDFNELRIRLGDGDEAASAAVLR